MTAGAPATHPLDARAVAAAEHQLLLENEFVRVLDARVAPGARTPIHAHEWPAVLYVLGTSDFVRYDPQGNVLLDSRTLVNKPRVGEATWSGPLVPHWLHNVGDSELRVIAVEIKPR
jgi:quercetin dioxygenase-like cupin family protein